MEPLLFLSHRIPFPPNKGDKVRSYHLLNHLAARYRIHLGTFVDDPADWPHVDALRARCASVLARPLDPRRSRIRSLAGLFTGEPLTLPYFRDRALQRWVNRTVYRERIRKCFVFSSAMAQYVTGLPKLLRVVDLVDVDSEKWRQYATERRWPLSWIYRREADRLLAWEAAAVREFDAGLLVTPAERALFAQHAPREAGRVHVVANGVDTDHFCPDVRLERPFPANEKAIVFTGAMDYWPNADAARWFASDILPSVVQRDPDAQFYVIGMNPPPSVRALAQNPAVTVTGRVPDTRPYLQHAAVAVAPLRLARGVQNKILEAMAMARPVVASTECVRALSAVPDREILVAGDASEFASRVLDALSSDRDGMGGAARRRVLDDYQWSRNLARIDALLGDAPIPAQPPVSTAPAVVHIRAASG
ncbi:MAG: TIGR03087 family PEP-CTERM/XrtA system glycosyltransferase [Burkholderiales bacterium]|nr:TIGR03087 family PEP-CTERM/XrtA system glycosyltransferase [Burkholderiales bacterium]